MIEPIKRNKKGEGIVSIIIVFAILFFILIAGLMLAFGGMVVKWTADELLPEVKGFGSVGRTNITEISGYALDPVNNFIQSFKWLSGIIYIFGLFGVMGMAVAFRITGNKWLMGFYIACMFMLIIASIFISIIYEGFYNDSGEVGIILHEYGILSFMILYSPIIMSVVGFVSGIIMFGGGSEEEQYG